MPRRRPPDYTARDWLAPHAEAQAEQGGEVPLYRATPALLRVLAIAVYQVGYALCIAIAHHRHPQRPGAGDDEDDED